MNAQGERPKFNPSRVAVAVAFLIWSALLFAAPAYVDVGDPWRWALYAAGLFFFMFGSIGVAVELGSVYGGSEGFRFVVFEAAFFAGAALLHLTTVYVPLPDWLHATLRLLAVMSSLVWSFFLCLGLARLARGLPEPTNRTDAIVTVLAFLGALLPILVSVFVSAP